MSQKRKGHDLIKNLFSSAFTKEYVKQRPYEHQLKVILDTSFLHHTSWNNCQNYSILCRRIVKLYYCWDIFLFWSRPNQNIRLLKSHKCSDRQFSANNKSVRYSSVNDETAIYLRLNVKTLFYACLQYS